MYWHKDTYKYMLGDLKRELLDYLNVHMMAVIPIMSFFNYLHHFILNAVPTADTHQARKGFPPEN